MSSNQGQSGAGDGITYVDASIMEDHILYDAPVDLPRSPQNERVKRLTRNNSRVEPTSESKVNEKEPFEVNKNPSNDQSQTQNVQQEQPVLGKAIYDSNQHQFNPIVEKIGLRKRRPMRSIDVADLEALHEAQALDSHSSDSEMEKHAGTNNRPKSKLLILMMTLFEGRDVIQEQIEPLTKEEKYILSSLLQRKFNITIPLNGTSKEIASTINSQRTLSKAKRLEENYKLVFKKALKYMLKKFKKHNDVKGKKSELELLFYKHYFQETFKKEGLEKEMDLNPEAKEFKGQALFNPKTINSKYVGNIMKSPLFQKNFDDFLAHHFISDYNKSREYKIQKVVEKCYECFNKKKGGGIDEVQKYIEKNPKCKLPWSDTELLAARESVKHLLTNKVRIKLKNH